MGALQNITFKLPVSTPTQRAAFTNFSSLLSDVALTSRGADYLPKVRFERTNSTAASVVASTRHEIALDAGESLSTPVGVTRLSISEVCERFRGNISEIDHVGVNLSPQTVGIAKIREILRDLASQTNLYAYPDGEPWYFVIPATEQERESTISDFSRVRRPKFELVADTRGPTPLIQVDFATKLNRAEVERLLPKPFGVGLPGLDQYFRSVFVAHPWGGFEMRFDFRYVSEELDEWSSGQWLITKGERYNQSVERRLEAVHRQ